MNELHPRVRSGIQRNRVEGSVSRDLLKLTLFLTFLFVLDRTPEVNRHWENFYRTVIVPIADWPLGEPWVAVGGFTVAGIFYVFVLNSILRLPKMKPEAGGRTGAFWLGAPFMEELLWMLSNIAVYMGVIYASQTLLIRPLGLMSLVHVAPSPHPPSLVRLAVEVMFSVWCYDFIFFWIHRSFHTTLPITIPSCSSSDVEQLSAKNNTVRTTSWREALGRWWYNLHLTHHCHYRHSNEAIWPSLTVHHHLLDASLQVGVNIVVQQIPLFFLFPDPSGRHCASKLLHNLVVTWLLIESHSGYDLPYVMSHRWLPGLLGGAVRHQAHHDCGKRYFHQFFKYLDDE